MANAPASWTIAVGGSGSTIFESSSPFIGTKCLEIRGDAGATLTKMSIALDGVTGSLYKPLRKYFVGLRIKADTGVAAGVMKVEVQNSANAAQDTSTLTIDLTATSTGSFDLETFSFETGASVTDTAKLVLELTTAITDTKGVFIDELVFAEMPQLGQANDPYAIGLRGATDFVRDDEFTAQITNNGEGQLVKQLDRWFDVHRLGYKYQVPVNTAGGETVPDTYVS